MSKVAVNLVSIVGALGLALFSQVLWSNETPTATAAVSLTVETQLRSLSITAYYGGNSDGRHLDQSAYANHLRIVGSPKATTSVAAAEGDAWLFGDLFADATSENDLFVAPAAAFPTVGDAFVGVIAWTLHYTQPGHVRSPILNRTRDPEAGNLIFEVGMTRAVFVLEWASPGNSGFIIPYHGMEVGNDYAIRVECHVDSVELLINGRSLDCFDKPMLFPKPQDMIIGMRPGLPYGNAYFLVDALMVSTDPHEPYPPLKKN